MMVTGNDEPDYDTLIAIANPTSGSQTARIHIYNQSGVVQTWSGANYKDVTLLSNHSMAFSFIPNNPFSDTPKNFKGYAVIDSLNGGQLLINSLLGGGGCYPKYWNSVSGNIPVISSLLSQPEHSVSYTIPYLADMNHREADGLSYRTHVVVTNFGSVPTITYNFTYRINDAYGIATVYTFTKTLVPASSVDFDLYTELLAVGYTAAVNSEGWLQIESQVGGKIASSPTGVWIFAQNKDDHNYSAGFGGQ